MPVADERDSPRSLEHSEIETGIKYFFNEALDDCLRKIRGAFYGQAYPSLTCNGKISIEIALDNFVEEPVKASAESEIKGGLKGEGDMAVEIEVEIPVMPPNQFRRDTDQPVVITRVEDGKRVEKRIKYQKRAKKGSK